ncbi:MAG: hypothetical protein NZT61_07430, partial [Deltaproteobacteria bacterium]|nr:hypothetical protein [Deltaproteobacteria bacterium]
GGVGLLPHVQTGVGVRDKYGNVWLIAADAWYHGPTQKEVQDKFGSNVGILSPKNTPYQQNTAPGVEWDVMIKITPQQIRNIRANGFNENNIKHCILAGMVLNLNVKDTPLLHLNVNPLTVNLGSGDSTRVYGYVECQQTRAASHKLRFGKNNGHGGP